MNEQELRDLIRSELESAQAPKGMDIQAVVRTAVEQTLITLGMDVKDPIQLQEDMSFLRDLRGSTETLKSRGMILAMGILFSAAAGALWMGIKASLSSQ